MVTDPISPLSDMTSVEFYLRGGRELLGELRSDSVLRGVVEPIIDDATKRKGISICSTKELPYLFMLLHRVRYSWFVRDGNRALLKLERAFDALHEQAQARHADEMDRRLQVLTREPKDREFRQVVSALSEIVVLGCLTQHWSGAVDLWPALPGEVNAASSDCLLRDRLPNVNVEVAAAWTDQDMKDRPRQPVARLYSRVNLPARRLVGTLREKRRQMRKCYANVLFLTLFMAFDERDDPLNVNGCQARFEADLGSEMAKDTWKGLNLLVVETDSAWRLVRVYDVHNTARDEAARLRLIGDIECAFRSHWYISDAYEVRPIHVRGK